MLQGLLSRNRRATIRDYFFAGQISLYGGILLSIVLAPEALIANDGVSYFATRWVSVLPFSLGLSIMAWCIYRIGRQLPVSASGVYRALVYATAALLFAVVIFPYGIHSFIATLHVIFSEALFVVQLLMLLWTALFVTRSRVGFVLFLAALFTAFATLFYLSPVARVLIAGELLFQVIFSIAIYAAVRHYTPSKPRHGVIGEHIPQARLARPLTENGFTIVELLIATAVFSVILLLCAFGLLQVSRVYQKGITSAKTQEVARSVTDEIARAIQFSGGSITTTASNRVDGTPYIFCIDDTRYSFVTDRQLMDPPTSQSHSKNVLVADTLIGCNASSAPLPITSSGFSLSSVPRAKELLGARMRLARLEVNSLGGTLYQVIVRVVYGDDDLLDAAHDNCQSIRAGGQFCAVSELNTVVQKRL